MKNINKQITVILSAFIVISLLCNPVSGENQKVQIKFFHTEGCDTCEEKKPVIYNITDLYGNQITVNWYMVEDDPGTENYTTWKSYGFEYVPSIVIINTENNDQTKFKYDEINDEDVIQTIENYLNGDENSESTPGFELLLIFIAIITLIYTSKKKN